MGGGWNLIPNEPGREESLGTGLLHPTWGATDDRGHGGLLLSFPSLCVSRPKVASQLLSCRTQRKAQLHTSLQVSISWFPKPGLHHLGSRSKSSQLLPGGDPLIVYAFWVSHMNAK